MTTQYSYIIRTPNQRYYTLPSTSLKVTLNRIESTLVQLATTGELSLEEVGTRIEDARHVVRQLEDRNEALAKERRANTVLKAQKERREKNPALVQQEGETDAHFRKRRRAHYAYESWLRKRDAVKAANEARQVSAEDPLEASN